MDKEILRKLAEAYLRFRNELEEISDLIKANEGVEPGMILNPSLVIKREGKQPAFIDLAVLAQDLTSSPPGERTEVRGPLPAGERE